MELLNKQERSKVVSVLIVGYSPDDSRACCHQTDNTTPLVSLGRMSVTWPYSNSTVFAGTGKTLCVLVSSWIPYRWILNARNMLRYSVYFGTAGIETITLAGAVMRSECPVVCQDSFNSFTVMSKLSVWYLYGNLLQCDWQLQKERWWCQDYHMQTVYKEIAPDCDRYSEFKGLCRGILEKGQCLEDN
jgi:hypothetical protein